jgi:phenylalanyl-tRNA synthetase beta chain
VSLVLKEDISVERVMEVITASGGNLLEDVQVADYYQGKQIEPGFKGLTISCHYRSRERTLTEAEVIPLHTAIIQALKDKLQAKIR